MEKQIGYKRSKLRFFAVYTVSVFLFIVIFAALWQGETSASSRPASLPSVIPDDSYRQADAFLHKRLGEIDSVYANAIGSGQAAVNAAKVAEKAFAESLDSLEREASTGENRADQNEWQSLVSDFRTALQARRAMMDKVALVQQKASENTEKLSVQDTAGSTAAIEELRALLTKKEEQITSLQTQSRAELAEKNQTIASLQAQVRKGSTAAPRQNNSGAEEEWKKKYNTVKSRHTELNQAYNALSASFQSVVADNRRLLGQLQQSRKQ